MLYERCRFFSSSSSMLSLSFEWRRANDEKARNKYLHFFVQKSLHAVLTTTMTTMCVCAGLIIWCSLRFSVTEFSLLLLLHVNFNRANALRACVLFIRSDRVLNLRTVLGLLTDLWTINWFQTNKKFKCELRAYSLLTQYSTVSGMENH